MGVLSWWGSKVMAFQSCLPQASGLYGMEPRGSHTCIPPTDAGVTSPCSGGNLPTPDPLGWHRSLQSVPENPELSTV